MLNKRTIGNLTPLGLLALVACKGTTGAIQNLSPSIGRVEDGPLHNAIAFLDYDGDGELDDDEPWERTGLDGKWADFSS